MTQHFKSFGLPSQNKTPDANMTTTPAVYLQAHGFLKTMVAIVAVYGIGMVTAGQWFATPLFDVLRFGPNAKGLDANGVAYSIFCFGVLGAVIVGWMSLMWCVVEMTVHHDTSVRAMARRALVISTAVWFFWDTGFSIVMGEYEHAAFNLPFVSVLAGPLYVMCTNDDDTEGANNNKKGQ